ncbi:signal recognition particle, SRP19 subunit [Agrocybe pediades]|nr:signal recognition particle, SRP19 subunit [Agrocybe pediades]
MSRRAAIVEEFDDDTDLPLPSQPLPNTGTRGPLLEEMHISDDEFEPRSSQRAGPASPSRYPPGNSASDSTSTHPALNNPSAGGNPNRVTDITPYKNWTCIYPIYIDAKRPYGTGERRIERAKSLWWPLSKDIADACSYLGLGTLHEVNKAHPRDWENPGRVRVQWKKDGKLVNPAIKTKKQLLEMICYHLQRLKPENIPRPPYKTTHTPSVDSSAPLAIAASNVPTPSQPPAKDKGKQPLSSAIAKSKSLAASHVSVAQRPGGRKLPVPPEPLPSLANRVSPYSPALSTGMLIETVKAGMNATEGSGATAGAGAPGVGGAAPGAGAKGKRKVVRVRG